ncbi:MAG: hypothetical protein U0V49_06240 [Saprospiraceae bacterium]
MKINKSIYNIAILPIAILLIFAKENEIYAGAGEIPGVLLSEAYSNVNSPISG